MRLRIVTPTRSLVDAEVSEITAPGMAGDFGILPEHVTFLGGLDVGILSYVEGGTPHRLLVDGGYSEVVDDVVTILASNAEVAEDVDLAVAREDLARIERDLDAGSEDSSAIDALLRDQKLAQTRIVLAS